MPKKISRWHSKLCSGQKKFRVRWNSWSKELNTGENNPSLLLGLFLCRMSSHLAMDSISIVQDYSPHTRLNSWHLGPAQVCSLNSKGGWGEHQELGEKHHEYPSLRLATSQVQGNSLWRCNMAPAATAPGRWTWLGLFNSVSSLLANYPKDGMPPTRANVMPSGRRWMKVEYNCLMLSFNFNIVIHCSLRRSTQLPAIWFCY